LSFRNAKVGLDGLAFDESVNIRLRRTRASHRIHRGSYLARRRRGGEKSPFRRKRAY
jgi:hypothetical protein